MNDSPVNTSGGVPTPGTILAGKYEVLGVLGQGGMGVVLQARNQRTEQSVAIKLLLPEARNMPDIVARFEREARAAARIQGPHVVRVYDVDNLPDGSPMMVMELLQGWDLGQELVARGPLPYPEAVEFILQACEAIGQAHQMGVIHRDIKPSNLYLCQEGTRRVLKVLDFGISKLIDPTNQTNQTQTATTFGTPQYMSPEQVRSAKHVDGRSDIWALGVVLFELLSGRAPFGADTSTATLAAIIADTPEDLRNIRADVPPKLAAAVKKALEKRPEDRFQDIGAFVSAISPFSSKNVSAATLAQVATPVLRTGSHNPTMRLAVISAAVATGIVAIGLALLAAKVRSPDPAPPQSALPIAADSSQPTITVTPAAALSTPLPSAAPAPAPSAEVAPPNTPKPTAPAVKTAPSPEIPSKPPVKTADKPPPPPPAPAPKPTEDPAHL
ncbi:MAG: serine/threonine protein kinase [Polyangiaceae bacterium]|nr:serine/threonine protein kinase [Polyangiaceae bacterium]